MQGFPHVYKASARASASSNVSVTGEGLPALDTAPPPEFGGPEGHWSPETLFSASVADCFILTFRAIARASKLEWTELSCDADGTLEKTSEGMRFTRFDLRACLTVPAGTDHGKAEKLLEKAEAGCLITNSLTAERHLETEISDA